MPAPRTKAALLVAALLTLPPAATAQARLAAPVPELDREVECLELVPRAASAVGVTDRGQIVDLDVALLVDRASTSRAHEIMERARFSYAPLGINLRVVRTDTTSLSGRNATDLNQQAKRVYGGARPAGVDVVYTFTGVDIEDGGNAGVAGLADCIGGVRFPDRAFAVGEDLKPENIPFGPFTLRKDATAKIAGHEIGHLMGAHHHYQSCVEPLLDPESVRSVAPCTLMSNFVDFQSLRFSAVEGATVRGHALTYAR